jgi:cAMP phosphodiesterase
MKIELLGCDGAPAPGAFPMSILIEGRLLIDAGSAASGLSLERRWTVEDVLISHVHLDHIRELGFLPADRDVAAHGLLTVWGTRATIEAVRQAVFTPKVWFDFADETTGRATMRYRPFEPFVPQEISGMLVEPVPLTHGAECTGFIVRSGRTCAVFAIDSGPTEFIWKQAAAGGPVTAAFYDVSFPNRMKEEALRCGHLTPELLVTEAGKLSPRPERIFACHLKPEHREEVTAELRQTGSSVEVSTSGDVVHI